MGTFLCLVGNNALLINKRMKEWHLSESDRCPMCDCSEENILHILRDSAEVRKVCGNC